MALAVGGCFCAQLFAPWFFVSLNFGVCCGWFAIHLRTYARKRCRQCASAYLIQKLTHVPTLRLTCAHRHVALLKSFLL